VLFCFKFGFGHQEESVEKIHDEDTDDDDTVHRYK
jgi:hypothetical protein